jgi:hypothetical protein
VKLYTVQDFELPKVKVSFFLDLIFALYTLGIGNYLIRRVRRNKLADALQRLLDNLNNTLTMKESDIESALRIRRGSFALPITFGNSVELLEARAGDISTQGTFGAATLTATNLIGNTGLVGNLAGSLTSGKFNSTSRVGDDESRRIDRGSLTLSKDELSYIGNLQSRSLPHRDLVGLELSGNTLRVAYRSEKLVQTFSFLDEVDLSIAGSILAHAKENQDLSSLDEQGVFKIVVPNYWQLLVRRAKQQVFDFAKPLATTSF